VNVLGSNVIRNANVAAKPVPVKALYAAATAIDASEFPNGATFLKAFSAKFGSAPVWGAHYSYDAVYALSDALRHSDSLKSADVLVTLKRFDPTTRVLQSMRFTESGEQKYPNIGVYKVERGKWALQFISANW
jgi:branched-chain amino acid transport system substrate-binding protein